MKNTPLITVLQNFYDDYINSVETNLLIKMLKINSKYYTAFLDANIEEIGKYTTIPSRLLFQIYSEKILIMRLKNNDLLNYLFIIHDLNKLATCIDLSSRDVSVIANEISNYMEKLAEYFDVIVICEDIGDFKKLIRSTKIEELTKDFN